MENECPCCLLGYDVLENNISYKRKCETLAM